MREDERAVPRDLRWQRTVTDSRGLDCVSALSSRNHNCCRDRSSRQRGSLSANSRLRGSSIQSGRLVTRRTSSARESAGVLGRVKASSLREPASPALTRPALSRVRPARADDVLDSALFMKREVSQQIG